MKTFEFKADDPHLMYKLFAINVSSRDCARIPELLKNEKSDRLNLFAPDRYRDEVLFGCEPTQIKIVIHKEERALRRV